MPIYEYRCPKCNATFEEWLRHADDAATCVCPSCNGEARRIISSTTFVLKGGGWYATEYGNRKTDTPSRKPEGATCANAEGASRAKAEDAPCAKTEGVSSVCSGDCPGGACPQSPAPAVS